MTPFGAVLETVSSFRAVFENKILKNLDYFVHLLLQLTKLNH